MNETVENTKEKEKENEKEKDVDEKKAKGRCLLERGVPVALINKDAKKEKLGRPPIYEMHYYHTRKPLITSRLAVAGTLLGAEDAPVEEEAFYKFMGLDTTLAQRGYRRVPSDLLRRIKERYPEGVTVLDPFAGTGMILFEALRLGCDVVGIDYNPVACLIMRCTLEYPLKYNAINKDGQFRLYSDVKFYAEKIYSSLKEKLVRFYPPYKGKEVKAYIHAWAVKCPYCGRETPIVQNWWLSSQDGLYLGYQIEGDRITYSVKRGEAPEGNMKEGEATCLFCTQSIKNDHIVEDISKNEREHLLALYLGKGEFAVAEEEQKRVLEEARQYLKEHLSELSSFIPTESMAADNRAHKYLKQWHRVFNPRQLLVLVSLASEIKKVVEEIRVREGDEYAAAIGSYLSMVLAKHVDYNSRSAGWHSSRIIIAHSLTMRGIGMMWNHAETNPFVKSSGSLGGMIQDVLDGLDFALNELNQKGLEDNARTPKRAEIINASILSWKPEGNRKFKFIITDPPYYDDVQYPEIMQFFQVWHARSVGHLLGIQPVPDTAEELSVGRYRDETTFEKRMLIAIRRLYDLLEDDGIATIFYAHKKIEGWKYLLEALRRSGFIVTSTIALMTESSENVLARGKSSIFHSLLLTARKRRGEKKGDIVEIEEEIKKKIMDRYDELEKIYGKDRTNLMVAASGLVLEVVTSYSDITSFTRDLSDYALETGQRFLIEAFAKKSLRLEQVDAPTMVYTWLRHAPERDIDYSEFNQTLKALGVSEQAVASLIERAGGRVRLLQFNERGSLEVEGTEPLVAGSLIDAVHLTLRAYMRGGATAAINYAEASPYGKRAILGVLRALAEAGSMNQSYEEGKVCRDLLSDWEKVSRMDLQQYL
jgi:putative DNA methylase